MLSLVRGDRIFAMVSLGLLLLTLGKFFIVLGDGFTWSMFSVFVVAIVIEIVIFSIVHVRDSRKSEVT